MFLYSDGKEKSAVNGNEDKQHTASVLFTLEGDFNTIIGDQNVAFANFFKVQLADISHVSVDRIKNIHLKPGK